MEASLESYRNTLNTLMGLVVKLNRSSEELTRANELYRVKLLNSELREKLISYKKRLDN